MAHPTHLYAQQVLAGEVVAGPHVRATCQRHLDDLAKSKKGKIAYRFDEEKATYIYGYFEQVLRIPGPTPDVVSIPFKLMDWQRFVLGSIFGWVTDDGLRRFTKAFILAGKGAGKSFFGAGIGLFCTTSDGEARAENFIIARDADQALIPLKAAVDIVGLSPKLSDRVGVRGGLDRPQEITYHGADGRAAFLRRVASEREGKGHSGATPHFVLVDEYHEHDTANMLQFYELGTAKGRAQPLVFVITNAGATMDSPCGHEAKYAQDVAACDIEDDSYFSYVCGLDDDDQIEDEHCWPKVMPSMPALPGAKSIRKQLTSSAGMTSLRANVERLMFCQWGAGAEAPWITLDTWTHVEHELVDLLSDDALREYPCYIGLDLGLKRDLSSATAVWDMGEDQSPRYRARNVSWTHEDELMAREMADVMPYTRWAEDGFLKLVPGNLMDYGYIARWLGEMMDAFEVMGVAADQWKLDELKKELSAQGIRFTDKPRRRRPETLLVLPHKQGFYNWDADEKRKRGEVPLMMPRSINAVEELIFTREIAVEINMLLRYAVQAVIVVMDASGNRKFDKTKQREKIDPAVSLAMAGGFAVEGLPKRRPFEVGSVIAR